MRLKFRTLRLDEDKEGVCLSVYHTTGGACQNFEKDEPIVATIVKLRTLADYLQEAEWIANPI